MDSAIAAAIEVPTGIPTGVPGTEAAAQRVITDGGITGALLILSVGVIVALFWEMWRRSNKVDAERRATAEAHEQEREEWQKQIQALQDKRIAELRDVMMTVNNSTAALGVLSQTQVDRTASSQEVARQLDKLILITTNNTEFLNRNLKSFEDRTEQVLREVRSHSTHSGGS